MASADYALRTHPSVKAVYTIDLSGRKGKREERVSSPGPLLALHRRLYSRLSIYGSAINVLRYLFQRSKLSASYRSTIERCDAVVIGGGQLLQHSRLQFPLLLRQIVRMCEEAGKPVIFWGVGVGSRWTIPSRILLKDTLCSDCVRRIYVRDELSRQRLVNEFPDLHAMTRSTCDLATAVSRVFDASETVPGTIGVAPLSPNAVARVNEKCFFADEALALKFWSAICARVLAQGNSLRVFTTGTNEDLAFSRMVVEDFDDQDVVEIIHPKNVEELCETISSLDVAITGRLHASILALSYNVPFQGAMWEPKVEGIAISSGRERSFFGETESATAVFDRLEKITDAHEETDIFSPVFRMADEIVQMFQTEK